MLLHVLAGEVVVRRWCQLVVMLMHGVVLVVLLLSVDGHLIVVLLLRWKIQLSLNVGNALKLGLLLLLKLSVGVAQTWRNS